MSQKKLYAWAMYDWANSAFATTVMAGFFPVFFKQYWSAGTDFNLTSARLGTAISLSSLTIALLSPVLGAMADHKGWKKTFCFLFMFMGAVACVSMAFIAKGDWFYACLAYGFGMVGFSASCVFYDAMLPSVASGKKADHASSLGYSLGYLGGGILFLLNIIMFKKPELFGFEDGTAAVKASFVSVGIWWVVFSLPLFLIVPEPKSYASKEPFGRLIAQTSRSLRKTIIDAYHNKNVFYFLVAFWFYIDGVHTVMTMAVDFGMSLGFNSGDLITALLIVQFIGFPFAYGFSILAQRYGCRIPILVCIVVYALMVIGATQMQNVMHFYILAAMVGMVQGGVQSLSRSLFSKMIPEKDSGQYFALYNLVGKFASIIGPVLVGWGAFLMGNARYGMLGLLLLFAVGGILLFRVSEYQSEESHV